jgi:hypothetical protein
MELKPFRDGVTPALKFFDAGIPETGQGDPKSIAACVT